MVIFGPKVEVVETLGCQIISQMSQLLKLYIWIPKDAQHNILVIVEDVVKFHVSCIILESTNLFNGSLININVAFII